MGTVAIFQIIHPLSLFVVVLYWTLDKPLWEFCAIKGSKPCHEWPDFFGFFVHGIDLLLLLSVFMIGRVPFYLSNSLWFIVYCLLYVLWTVVHFLLKIGVREQNKCTDYSQNECPIYTVLDWHHPEKVIKLMIPVLCVG